MVVTPMDFASRSTISRGEFLAKRGTFIVAYGQVLPLVAQAFEHRHLLLEVLICLWWRGWWPVAVVCAPVACGLGNKFYRNLCNKRMFRVLKEFCPSPITSPPTSSSGKKYIRHQTRHDERIAFDSWSRITEWFAGRAVS